MGKVTAVHMAVTTDKSGHVAVGMAPSVCTTPAAPSPIPVPYPITSSSAEGCIKPAMRTKIEGAKVITVGSDLKACHGNEPGTLKELVSLNTGGPTFMLVGAPTVFVEMGMQGITGSPGMKNRMMTGGGSGSASSAGGGAGGGGGGGGGAGGGGGGGPSGPGGGGGAGGGTSTGASASTDRALAAEPGATKDQIAARKRCADRFFRQQTVFDHRKQKQRTLTDAEISSRMKGVDFNHPVRTRPPSNPPDPNGLPPLGPQERIHAPGKDYGNWFSPAPKPGQPSQTPDQVGVGRYGTTSTGTTDEKVCTPYGPPAGSDPAYMQSTAAPISDTWSGEGVFGKQTTKGGGTQNYVPQGHTMKQTGPSGPI